MSNTSDYSFLIQSIEGKFAAAATTTSSSSSSVAAPTVNVASTRPFINTNHHQTFQIPETPSYKNPDLSLSAIVANTSAKKRRISEIVLEDVDTDDFTMNTRDFKITQPKHTSSSTLKLQMQVDELKLLNEQLKEQLKSYKAEHDLFKDQSARQLKFLEDLNHKYKAEVEVARQKYYDEKKKWQTKLRESEDAMKKLQLRLAEQSTSGLENSFDSTNNANTHNANSSSHQQKESLQRMRAMEQLLAETQATAQRHYAAKLEAEERCTQLEQSLKVSSHVSSQSDQDTASEYRQLRKQYQELETLYRRKNKEAEKLILQVKNQNMLEEELASTVTKLQLSQETVKTFQTMEVDYRRLLEDRKTWNQVFHSLAKTTKNTTTAAASSSNTDTSSNSGSSSSSILEDMSPTRAANMVQELQQQCLLYHSQVGDLERQISSLRPLLSKAEEKCLQWEQEKHAVDLKYAKLASKQSLFAQQARLYESEVLSLRTMLQSFDFEFRMSNKAAANKDPTTAASSGSHESSVFVKAKDDMIALLRQEIDQSRQHSAELLQKHLSVQEKHDSLEQELVTAKQQLAVLLQESVTTAAANNSTNNNSSSSNSNSQDKEIIKQLKEDYRALQEVSGVDYLPHKTQILHFKMNPSAPFFQTLTHANANSDSKMQVDENTDEKNSSPPNNHDSSVVPKNTSSLPTDTVKYYRQLNRLLQTKLNTALETIAKFAQEHTNNNNSNQDDHSNNNNNNNNSPNSSMMYFGTHNMSTMITANKNTNSSSNNNNTNTNSNNSNVVDQVKLNQRLKEMFKEKISLFREAVYLLTGYKMELYTTDIDVDGVSKTVNRLKIRSMYAEKPDDLLIFQLSDNGPELLESDFANHMDETLIQHLQRYQSVPAFLANVTLTLFENSTFMG